MRIKLFYVVLTFLAFLHRNVTFSQNSPTQPVLDKNIPGQSSTALSPPAFEDVPIYRLQLRLTTGRTNDAGTDDPVFVQMNNKNDSFYLVKGKDNFAQGSTETYDVLIRRIKKIRDIDFIRIGVNGDDGVCIKKIELLINNEQVPFFSKQYPGTTGICIDKGSSSLPATFTIPGSELRNSSQWKYTISNRDCWKPPVQLTKEWLVSMVEASVGNQIYKEGGKLKWGTNGGTLENKTLWGDPVEMTRVSDNIVHFDLDLELDRAGPNPEVDVDFDLVIFCNEGRIKTEMMNVKIGTDDIGKALDFLSILPGIGHFLLNALTTIGDKIVHLPNAADIPVAMSASALGLLESAMEFDVKLDINRPNLFQGCTKIKVENNGNITLR